MQATQRKLQVTHANYLDSVSSSCTHVIKCAVTVEERKRATDDIAKGVSTYVAFALAQLNGPCTVALFVPSECFEATS